MVEKWFMLNIETLVVHGLLERWSEGENGGLLLLGCVNTHNIYVVNEDICGAYSMSAFT